MKKFICILLVVLTVFACVACTKDNSFEAKIGTSKVSIFLPEGYTNVKENYGEDQVAHYFLDKDHVFVDAYQWLKVANFPVWEEARSYANKFAADVFKVTIETIELYHFTSRQTEGSIKYTVENYFIDDGAHIVMICFWTRSTDDHKKFVEETIKSISIDA